jgi:hypothetical protein
MGQIDFDRGRIAVGVVAAQREQIRAIRFSRVNVIAGIRGGVCALPAVWTDGGVDGVDDVLGEK